MVTESAGWGAHVAACRHWLLHVHQSGEAAIISLSPGAMQIWAPRTKPRNLVLGQRRPSGKSREAGRPGNAEDRQPMKAALVDNNPHGRSIAAGRQLAPFGRTYKDFISELHLYLPPKIPQQIILITVPISQFNLCCIISKFWCTHNLPSQASRCFVFVRMNTRQT